MFTLTEILELRGLDTKRLRIKMIRHQHPPFDLSELIRRDQFDLYQWNQGKPMYNCDIAVSFMGIESTKAKLVGVYEILDCEGPINKPWPKEYLFQDMLIGQYYYTAKKLTQFSDFENRLVIDWGKSARSWHQWLKDRRVIEILPEGYIGEFPGYLEFSLSYTQLVELANNLDSNRIWHHHLRAVGGVYLILDQKTGNQYIGSASGKSGILGRWESYAKDGHGGNEKLRRLVTLDSQYKHNFKFTILQTLPKSLTRNEIIEYEIMYKEKLGSRTFGLNIN